MANSYLNSTSSAAGGAAIIAEARKVDKYQDLSRLYEVIPVAIETIGPSDPSDADFINGIDKLIAEQTGDHRETSFFWQRLFITLHRFNAVCFRGSFKLDDLEILAAIQPFLLFESFLSNSQGFYTRSKTIIIIIIVQYLPVL